MTEIVNQEISVMVLVNGYEYAVTDLTTNLSLYNDADTVEVTALPLREEAEPDIRQPFNLHINGEQVFRGEVYSSAYQDDAAYKIKAMDNAIIVKNTEIESLHMKNTPVSNVARTVLDKVGVSYNIDVAQDIRINMDRTNANAATILNKLADSGRCTWWIDHRNELQFRQFDSVVHNVDYIIEADAGKITPPYLGVLVRGDGVVSEYGTEYANMQCLTGAAAKSSLQYNAESQQWEIQKGTLNEPVFKVQDQDITTAEQARAVAENIIRQFRKQAAGGTVTFVGQAAIRKEDAIAMPTPMGGGIFGIEKINHRLDGNDGYTTKVTCSGLIPAQYGPASGVDGGVIY